MLLLLSCTTQLALSENTTQQQECAGCTCHLRAQEEALKQQALKQLRTIAPRQHFPNMFCHTGVTPEHAAAVAGLTMQELG